MEAGAKDDELIAARKQIRHAQVKWDYIAASNGMGFHSPAEALRILAGSVDLAGQARLEEFRPGGSNWRRIVLPSFCLYPGIGFGDAQFQIPART